ncbi:MAG TPA: RuBisCO large subunit C-terminal-like domain-containing protein [Anaerolineales bacterium]|nr:RuBisCO large subunit C-terminal-like domain-containing protein [Anaerolineales bacterium]
MAPDHGFTVTYRFKGGVDEALARAHDLRYEQTVEFPPDLTPDRIAQTIVGQVVGHEPDPAGGHRVTIAYPTGVAAGELTQFLNVVFGNSSIKPGIRVERFDLSVEALAPFRGPRFGRAGLRAKLGAPTRPLLCTALKPMGLSPGELARQAYQFALGGIDLIKDDHGLSDQTFAPYSERVRACVAAVADANAKTGYRSLYLPNVTAPLDRIVDRAFAVREAGASGLLISPGLTGFDAARLLAADDALSLPLISHPALLGSFTVSPDAGFSHFALYGQLGRLAGIDAVVFPSWGGRFAFTREECAAIARGTLESMGALAPSFPAPGGGMKRERVQEMLDVYGRDVIFLIGGDLHRPGPDLADTSWRFRELVEAYA